MNAHLLETKLATLSQASPLSQPTIGLLASHLTNASDEDLFRMSPLRFAESEGLEETEALDLFLWATHVGVLDFSWGILCPACLAYLTVQAGLQAVGEGRMCELCRCPAAAHLEERVEVCFTVNAAIRPIRQHHLDKLDIRKEGVTAFFSPSLRSINPVKQQFRGAFQTAEYVEAGETAYITAPTEAGSYAMISPTVHAVFHFDVSPEGATHVDPVDLISGRCMPSDLGAVAPGTTMELCNRLKIRVPWVVLRSPVPKEGDRPAQMPSVVERLDRYLSGKRLLTAQTFQDLFQTHTIPTDAGLELRSLTILFTDLKGSTELYERVGDLRAYDLVRRHFDALLEAVSRHGGAVVKTIGDAVMAAFPEPEPGVLAAAEMIDAVRGIEPDDTLQLKIGLHTGPCIAVALNDQLDYFGRTVNVAARVQGQADAGEIVCTEDVFRSTGISNLLDSAGLVSRLDDVTLKGIGNAQRIHRITPDFKGRSGAVSG